MITPAPGPPPGTISQTTDPHTGAGDATHRGRAARSVGATLAAALLLPLGACSSHSFSERAEVTEVIDFRNPDEFHTLIVDSSVGDIEVIGQDGASGITAEIVKVGRGSSPEKARESLERIEIVMAPLADDPGAFLCTSEFPEKWPGHAHNVEWRIIAPSSLELDLVSGVGDIDIQRFANGARVRSDVGDVVLRNVSGVVDVRSDVGDIELVVSGPVKAVSDVGDVEITLLDSGDENSHPIEARSDVGDIELLLPRTGRDSSTRRPTWAMWTSKRMSVDAYSILSRSRSGKSMRVELNGRDEPVHVLRANVGDVEIDFHRTER